MTAILTQHSQVVVAIIVGIFGGGSLVRLVSLWMKRKHFVSAARYSEVRSELKVVKEYQNLVEEQREQIKFYKSQIDDLIKSNRELREEIKELHRENNELGSKVAGLEAKLDCLTRELNSSCEL